MKSQDREEDRCAYKILKSLPKPYQAAQNIPLMDTSMLMDLKNQVDDISYEHCRATWRTLSME